MAKNQSTYTLHIDAELGNLQQTLNTAKNSLASFMQSGNAPKGLEKAFEKINDLLGQISDKTGKPLDLKGLTGAGKDLNTVQENFRAIVRLLGEFDNLSDDVKLTFLSTEEQKKVTAITEALKNYGVAAENSAKKIKELENAQKNLTKNEGQLNRAKKNVGGLETKKASKEAALEGARVKLSAAQASGANPEKIADYQAKVTQLEADLSSLNRQLTEANEELFKAQNAYDTAANAVSTLGKEAKQTSLDALHGLKEEAKKLGVSLEGLNGHDAATQIEILKRRLSEFKSEAMKGAKPAFDAIKEGCEKAEDAVESLGEGVKAGTEAVKEMDEAAAQRDAFEAKIKSFLGLSGAAQVLRASLRDALQTITELDATMTQMAVVTDLTVGDYWDQLPEYSQRASELGVSINDAYKAATLYYQQGLKTNEVNAISAETLKLAKVAGIDAAEATDKMTAALRGFNMELNETSAQKVADVYAELAAITAADVNEISTAMTKTASIASSAGMEFETTAAFLSQIIETTRESAETAGTAMKTVIARFQELKKDPSEIGEVDGEIVDANAIETALRSVGVSLRDAQGQFRELDDVFLELSSKWDGLDTNTQRYIATIAAGSRQQSRFIAMMQDYGRTQELVSAANNSAGASNRQFEKTMESLEAKIEKLKNAWHEFTMGIMNSDLVKTGVDILTKFLEIINKATSGIGGLGGSLVKIVSVLNIFKLGSKIFSKFKDPMVKFFAEVVQEAGLAGEKSMQEFQNRAEKAKQPQTEESSQEDEAKRPQIEASSQEKEAPTQDKKGLATWIQDKTGISQLKKGLSAKKNKEKEILDKKQVDYEKKAEAAQARFDKAQENAYQDPEEFAAATEELSNVFAEYDNRLELTEEDQKAIFQAGQEGWGDIAKGIGEVGQTLSMAGVGLSMFGGLLSSLGLEEFGEALAKAGNYVTIFGTILSTLPAIFTMIETVATATGVTISTALWMVTLIVAAVAIVAATIAGVVSFINKNSPEEKLKKAEEAADKAKQAADEAAEAYENLASALDSIGDKYKNLEELTEGTAEWGKAVRDVNASVLDLIDKYPELAGFVESEGGVLKLDVDSKEVQQALTNAETKAITAQNESILANAAVQKAQIGVKFGELDAIEQIASKRGWESFGKATGAGAAIGGGTGVGAIGGAIAGATVGAITGPIEAAATKTDEQLQNAVQGLAEHIMDGGGGKDYDSMYKYLTETMGIVGDEAAILAEEFSGDIDSLLSYYETIKTADAQQKAAFDSIAASAQGLADTLSMSSDEIKQSSNLVDGDIAQEFYKEQEKMLNEKYSDDKSFFESTEVKEAVRKKYGASATVDKNGNITYQKDGEQVTTKLTREEMTAAMATEYATAQSAMAIEFSDNAIEAMSTNFSKGAVEAMYNSKNGKDLTSAQLESIQETENWTDKQWQDMWDSLGDAQIAFGNDIEKMKEDYAEASKGASKAFDKAKQIEGEMTDVGQILQGFMTSSQAESFANQVKEVYEKTGADGANKVLEAFNGALEGKTDEEKQQITQIIAAYDWTTSESLDKMVAELTQQGEVTLQQAETIKKTIAEYNRSTDSFALTINAFGEAYQAMSKLETIETRITKLQWEYNRALEAGGDSLTTLTEQLAQAQVDKYKAAVSGYSGKMTELTQTYGRGMNIAGQDLTQYVDFTTDESGNITGIDTTRLSENYTLSGKEEVQEWVESLKTIFGEMGDFEQTGRDAIDAIQEMKDSQVDAIIDLKNQIKDTILSSFREQLELEQSSLEASREADSAIMSKMQEQLDFERQQKANEEAEQNIEDMYAKAAYLGMDTSGANALEQAQLEEEIAQAEEDYLETRIDQGFQSIQDANDKASEQRERQIALQEAALETYSESKELQEKVNEYFALLTSDEDNPTAKAFEEKMLENSTLGMTEEERKQQEQGMAALVSQATGVDFEEFMKQLDAKPGDFNAAVSGVRSGAIDRAYTNQINTLQDAKILSDSFTTANLSTSDGQSKLEKAQDMYDEDQNNASNISEWKSTIEKAKKAGAYTGEDVQSQQEYYEALGGNITADTTSYTDYVRSIYDSATAGRYGTMREVYGGVGIPTEATHMRDDAEVGEEFDIWINKQEDEYVYLGAEVTDASLKDKLSTISSVSGGHDGVYIPDNQFYLRAQNKWWQVYRENDKSTMYDLAKNYADTYDIQKKYQKFKTGGLADFTGPAWLDGTPSKPEYILNAEQTERFFSLIDVLESFKKGDSTPASRGDNYIDIDINVEKLENDYDVEQVANKIRKMLHEDAMYRNVNAVNPTR